MSFCLKVSLAKADVWKYCAAEDEVCRFNGTAKIRYGINGTYNTATFTDSVGCNNAVFGDPVVGVRK